MENFSIQFWNRSPPTSFTAHSLPNRLRLRTHIMQVVCMFVHSSPGRSESPVKKEI